MTWQRDAFPLRKCWCGHFDHSHDLKDADRRGPCRAVLTGCDCPALDPAELLWTERRTVSEPACPCSSRPHDPDCPEVAV